MGDAQLTQILDGFCRHIESFVASELEKLRQSLEIHQRERSPPSAAATTGVEVAPADKVKAADLRTALLLGKLPEDAGLLIDTKVVARLLSISPRMVFSLDQEEAMPAPVRVGRLVRWSLTEIIEWVDSGCPPRHKWRYSGSVAGRTKKNR
jgi:predicted DNA-binding transcriptional regulator AlpA